MPRGGKRPGAGRKPSAVTQRKTEIAQQIAERQRQAEATRSPDALPSEIVTPLEVMLANMRHAYQVALDAEAILAELGPDNLTAGLEPEDQFKVLLAEVKKTVALRQEAQACARDAAPFFHARIAPQEANKGKAEEHVPLADRLKNYTRKSAIEESKGKVVEMPAAKKGRAK